MKKVTEKRQFEKLRISLTDHCNLACTYCVEDESGHHTVLKKGATPLLLSDFIDVISKLHSHLNLKTVRLTGGEPLLFKDIIPLIKAIKSMGVPHVGLTTNAYYLKRLAGKLKHAGLDSINISLDALDPAVFKKMTRKPLLEQTLEGILAAVRYGFDLKINSVILKGINENQIIPLLKFGKEQDIPVRFLELMKMGYLHHNYQKFFIGQHEILQIVKEAFDFIPLVRKDSATSNYWKVEQSNYTFGVIANETAPFCSDCNRLRLDSFGNIYGCISSDVGIPIHGAKNNLGQSLSLAMKQKQPIHFIGSELSMQYLGG